MTFRVVVVGGGVAGLATAHYLRRAVPDPDLLEVVGVEAASRLGGSLWTEQTQGFLLEAGADSFLTARPAALRLARELGLGERLRGLTPQGRTARILHRGRLHPLPEGFTLVAPPRWRALARSPLLSPWGKVRAALDLVLPARVGAEDESVASFVRRRFGGEVLDRMAGPVVAGIHAGDAERLSAERLLGTYRTYERERGSVLRGLRSSARAPPPDGPEGPRPFATLAGGMGELTDGLLRGTKHVAWTRTTAVARVLRQGSRSFEVELEHRGSLDADAVVLATPSPVSARAVRTLAPSLASALASIPYASSATVTLAFPDDAWTSVGGSGFLVPDGEGLRLKACTLASQKFPGRAPSGHVLARAFFGGAKDASVVDLSDEELRDLALRELGPVLGLRAAPELVRVHRWREVHPQYDVGHDRRLESIAAELRGVPGLALTGSAYRGVGIPDCVADAEKVAYALTQTLVAPPQGGT